MSQIENLNDLPRAEREYLRFVFGHSDALLQDWEDLQSGTYEMSDIIDPIYAALHQDTSDAKTAAAGFQESFLSFVRSKNRGITDRMDILRAAAITAGIDIPSNLFAGGFATHSFNAQACLSDQTNLLLVHSGLEQLLIEATRLLFALHQKSAPLKAERLLDPVWLEDATADSLIFDFAQILASFLARAVPVPMYLDEDRYPFEADKEIWAFSTATSAQDFVLAHELGHVALGHLDDGSLRQARPLRSGLKVFGKSQQQEFAADSFAARLLFGGTPPSGEQSVLDLIYGKYMGVGVFFDLDDLLSEIERRAFDVSQDDPLASHPPARSREANVLAELRKLPQNSFLFADRRALGRTVKRYRETLIAEAVTLILDYDWD